VTTPETSTDGISEETVLLALAAHFRARYYAETPDDNVPGRGPMRAALVAAGVPDLIADLAELREIARRVDMDYTGKCCDHPADCSCSMGQLHRWLAARQGLDSPMPCASPPR